MVGGPAGRDHPAAILMADPDNPLPNAGWRRKIAEASTTLKSRPVFVMVSTSLVARGVVTAINWLRPPPYEHAVYRAFDEAGEWVARPRGRAPRPPAKPRAEARTASAPPAHARAAPLGDTR